MERWEYTSFKMETKGFTGGILEIEDFNIKLNEFGQRGWDLVSCVANNSSGGNTREIVAIFKRKAMI